VERRAEPGPAGDVDFAACLYQLALTGYLDLHINLAIPPADQTEAVAQFISHRREFMKFQCAYESAISTAI
jgi:hypothetical protein